MNSAGKRKEKEEQTETCHSDLYNVKNSFHCLPKQFIMKLCNEATSKGTAVHRVISLSRTKPSTEFYEIK